MQPLTSGFLWVVFKWEATTMLHEHIRSFRAVRRHLADVPTALYSNVASNESFPMFRKYSVRHTHYLRANASIRYFDQLVLPKLHKLHALVSTPFSRTIFLDNDVYLLSDAVWQNAWTIWNTTDVAMPMDPVRSAPYDSMPLGCSAMIFYSTTEPVLQLFRDAYELLRGRKYPHLRQGDQSHINRAWITMHPHLRFFVLPEEYYCPWNSGSAVWRHKLEYACKALHGHEYSDQVLDVQGQSVHHHHVHYHGHGSSIHTKSVLLGAGLVVAGVGVWMMAAGARGW